MIQIRRLPLLEDKGTTFTSAELQGDSEWVRNEQSLEKAAASATLVRTGSHVTSIVKNF